MMMTLHLKKIEDVRAQRRRLQAELQAVTMNTQPSSSSRGEVIVRPDLSDRVPTPLASSSSSSESLTAPSKVKPSPVPAPQQTHRETTELVMIVIIIIIIVVVKASLLVLSLCICFGSQTLLAGSHIDLPLLPPNEQVQHASQALMMMLMMIKRK